MNKFVYMDASASWLKPQSVIESEVEFLQELYANAGRGVCARAGKVDDLIANSRQIVADFIGARCENIVFTSGTTDSLNRIVNIVKNTIDKKCPVVAVSDLDHHSARLPWEMCAKNGECEIVVMPLDENLNIDVNKIPNADVFVITGMSNVLGVQQDVKEIIHHIHMKNKNAITIVDAAQSVVHSKLDVYDMGCDFLCFSGHKIGADTGVGVMYIKNPDVWNLDKFGGGMVNKITESGIVFNNAPEKFEAGTLPLTQIIGLPSAIKYLSNWNGGQDFIHYMYDELAKLKNVKLLSSRDACMITFVVKNMHVLDFGALVGANNICLRVGNMCATWIHKKMNIDGSVRISVGPWNTVDDAKYVIDTIKSLVG